MGKADKKCSLLNAGRWSDPRAFTAGSLLDTDNTDLDLHVVTPDGEHAWTVTPC